MIGRINDAMPAYMEMVGRKTKERRPWIFVDFPTQNFFGICFVQTDFSEKPER
jgi:hypothetical protein